MRFLIALAFAIALASGGCSDDGPTEPGPPTGPNVVRIEDPANLLAADTSAIRALAESTLARATLALPITGVTITVRPDAAGTIAGYGLGGRTPDAATVSIYVDPAFPDLSALLPDRLPGLVAHELHHAVRWRNPGYGRTLLEAMVSEGMADRFAVELLDVPAPPWSTALSPGQMDEFLAIARAQFDDADYDHEDWFFGAHPTIPRWTGYTLGYAFVVDYETSHPGTTAAGLVTARASQFRPAEPTSSGGAP